MFAVCVELFLPPVVDSPGKHHVQVIEVLRFCSVRARHMSQLFADVSYFSFSLVRKPCVFSEAFCHRVFQTSLGLIDDLCFFTKYLPYFEVFDEFLHFSLSQRVLLSCSDIAKTLSSLFVVSF